MGLRIQTIRIICLTVGCTVIGLYLVLRLFFLSGFLEIEQSLVVEDVRRALNAMHTQLRRIDLLTADWATWDDAYAFMENGNRAFIESNLTRETFIKQRLAVVCLFDLAGRLVAGRQWDQAAGAFVPVSPDIAALFSPGTGLLLAADAEDGREGLVMLGDGPMLLALAPILDSEKGGPARGTLIMGAWFDQTTVSQMAEDTLLDIRVRALDAPEVPRPAAAGFEDVVAPGAREFADTILGYGLVRDIFAKPAFWLEMETDRRFFVQGRRLAFYSLGFVLAAGVALAGLLLYFFEKKIVRRVRALSEQTGQIARGGGARCIYLPGPDELGLLAKGLNAMLDRLAASQRSLEASEKRYRALFEGIGAATIVVGPDETIDLANDAFVRLSGLDRETLEGGLDWRTFFLADTVRELLAVTGFAAVADRTVQAPFLRRDGAPRHVHLTMADLPWEGARIISLVDNTAGRQAEQELAEFSRRLEELVAARTRELEAANERLRQLDQIKSSILYAVSHELRTPLTSIRGFASIIERDFEKLVGLEPALESRRQAQRIRHNLGIVIEENQRLTALINDFLDLSKIESGRMDWRDTAIEASELAGRAAGATAALFDGGGAVTLEMDVADGMPALVADEDRMLQVCINLIGNARKFTTAGQVRLAIGLDDQGDWLLRVSDTGIGIAPENIEKIFDSFFQVVRQEGRPAGTGLGLAICRDIVEHYGGRIWAESRLGQGSDFFVSLPRTRLRADAGPKHSA